MRKKDFALEIVTDANRQLCQRHPSHPSHPIGPALDRANPCCQQNACYLWKRKQVEQVGVQHKLCLQTGKEKSVCNSEIETTQLTQIRNPTRSPSSVIN